MRKLTFFVLTAIILMSVCVVPVWGACGVKNEQNIVYDYFVSQEGESYYRVEGFYYNGDEESEVEIPSTVDGIPVQEISDKAFENCKNLTKVTLNENLMRIGKNAFYGCESLKTIEFSNTVECIGAYAFYGCASLKTIEIPNSVELIETYAFSKSGLESVILSSGLKTIDDYAFALCDNLKEIDFSNGVERIGKFAFEYCKKIERIDIPNSVVTIDDGAFYGGYSLSEINLGNGVQTIGKNAFASCSANTLIIPDSVTIIEDGAFMTNSIQSIIIPASVTTIEQNAFYGGFYDIHFYCEFDSKPDGWDDDWDVLFEDVRFKSENIHWVGTPLPENIIEPEESENTESISQQDDNTADERNNSNVVWIYILSAVAVAELVVIVLMALKKSKK